MHPDMEQLLKRVEQLEVISARRLAWQEHIQRLHNNAVELERWVRFNDLKLWKASSLADRNGTALAKLTDTPLAQVAPNYLLFTGEDYYPNGGADDLRSIHDRKDQAITALAELAEDPVHRYFNWAHLLELPSEDVVMRWKLHKGVLTLTDPS